MLLPTCDGRQATRDSDASGRSTVDKQQKKVTKVVEKYKTVEKYKAVEKTKRGPRLFDQ